MSDEPGVQLAHYLDHHRGVRVLFCCPCGYSYHVDLRRIVLRLKAKGLGDASTGIRAIGPMAANPCPRCGAARWETRPQFPPGSAG